MSILPSITCLALAAVAMCALGGVARAEVIDLADVKPVEPAVANGQDPCDQASQPLRVERVGNTVVLRGTLVICCMIKPAGLIFIQSNDVAYQWREHEANLLSGVQASLTTSPFQSQ
jgi:hypothetical protein